MNVSKLKTALAQVVIDDSAALELKRARLTSLCDTYLQNYEEGDVSLLRAPARINVLGEHIDYVSYLPTASLTFGSRERDALFLYRKSPLPFVRGCSTSPGYDSASFSIFEDPAPHFGEDAVADWRAFLTEYGTPEPHWQNYIQGAVVFARGKYGQEIVSGFDFALDSNIPAGGGASSSSALVVLGGASIRYVNEIPFTREQLAQDSALAEWFIGTRGGSMDHTTICLAQPSSAVLINYSTHEIRRIGVPDTTFEWITFFSQPANKGREVMLEYNERAAVSRLIIPSIISKWEETNPELYNSWNNFLRNFGCGNIEAIAAGERLIESLPESISIKSLRTDPELFLEFQRSFTALLHETNCWPLPVRIRARHHLGEVRRVALAEHALASIQNDSTPNARLEVMRTLGKLIDESHASLRDLYGVSTDEVEQLIQAIRSDANVFGARLMGGGFGGNVLALTRREHSNALIESVQKTYYGPRGRDGVAEGSVMISTPGEGLSHVVLTDLWREVIAHINSLGRRADSYVANLRILLDVLPIAIYPTNIWPVIVAAGKGTRAATSGLNVSKPLALVGQKPAIVHVLDNIQAGLGPTRPPVVIVSPETMNQSREQLQDRDVIFVTQKESLGTGDAVLWAKEIMKDFDGLSLVVWSTQPVIRPATFKLTAKLAGLFDSYQMVVPTAFRQHPYAPIERSEFGEVQAARETHLESAESIDFGETNIGMFLLKNQTMFELLQDLRDKYWNEANRCYDRSHGELGFPNELINTLAQRQNGVFASPISDWREEQGIKHLSDIAKCESFISELEKDDVQTT